MSIIGLVYVMDLYSHKRGATVYAIGKRLLVCMKVVWSRSLLCHTMFGSHRCLQIIFPCICRYYEFVDRYNFDREVVGIALNYFDRYISKRSPDGGFARETYQLIAVSVLFLAIKVHAACDDGSASRTKALSGLIYGHFEGQDVLAKERDILVALDWFVNPPTFHQIALAFSEIHPLRLVSTQYNTFVYEAARYQCELALFLPDLLMQYRPSEIVFAAMLNAMEKIDPAILTEETKRRFMSILHHPEMSLDESKVIEVKEYMKCEFTAPHELHRLPGGSASPTNVTERIR